MSEIDDEVGSAYSRLVGERLRSIRLQKNMSLGDVEQRSNQEFKASVLGAYERGERAISVPRLERLASFYSVPIDQLLPQDDVHGGGDNGVDLTRSKLAINVAKLSQLSGQPFEMLVRFLRMIQVQRQDFNGKVITVRAHDTRAIAVMLDVPVDNVGERLADLGLLFPRTQQEAEDAPKKCRLPLVYVQSRGNRDGRPIIPRKDLEQMGYIGCIEAQVTLCTEFHFLKKALTELRNTGDYTGMTNAEYVASRQAVEDIIGLDEYYEIEAKTVEARQAKDQLS